MVVLPEAHCTPGASSAEWPWSHLQDPPPKHTKNKNKKTPRIKGKSIGDKNRMKYSAVSNYQVPNRGRKEGSEQAGAGGKGGRRVAAFTVEKALGS